MIAMAGFLVGITAAVVGSLPAAVWTPFRRRRTDNDRPSDSVALRRLQTAIREPTDNETKRGNVSRSANPKDVARELVTEHHRISPREQPMTPTAQTLTALCSITPAQAIAVDRLTCGHTHAVAAAAAGVTRETVTRWVSHHPGVRAALDSARWATSLETIDRIALIRQRALDVVEQHLETLDPDDPEALATAVTVLKVLPVAEAPARRPELAETMACRDLERIRMGLHTDETLELLFPASLDPEHLMLDAVTEAVTVAEHA